MMKQSIEDVIVAGQRVLMRVDFNVPIDVRGRILDDYRVRATLPSIQSVLARDGRLILMSHLGRPKTIEDRTMLSLRPIAERLRMLLNRDVASTGQVIGDEVENQAARLHNGDVLLLENLRFHPGELEGDLNFGKALATLGDVYCNDAFGSCHRLDASLVVVPEAMGRRPKVVGLLVEKEMRVLTELVSTPERPFVAVLGGIKVSDKINALNRLVEICDRILIGGALANTFALAEGGRIGSSLAELDQLDVARNLLERAENKVVLPFDFACAASLRSGVSAHRAPFGQVPDGLAAYDVGPTTIEQFGQEVQAASTIFWNGPVGAYETPPFDAGTWAIAEAIVRATAKSVVGGGDTAAALRQFGFTDRVFHVSTGGGASLALLAGERLIALELLNEL